MPRRLVISVEPALLGTSLAAVLAHSYDVTFCDYSDATTCEGDVAIVSGTRRDDIRAGTVISLPDIEGNAGIGLVWIGDDSEPTPIRISTLADLIKAVAAVPT